MSESSKLIQLYVTIYVLIELLLVITNEFPVILNEYVNFEKVLISDVT